MKVYSVSCLLSLLSCGFVLYGQADINPARMREFNNELLRLHAEIGRTPQADQAALRSSTAGVIEQRAAFLSALTRGNPRQALSLAFSPEFLSELATTFPQSASQLEAHGTWRGILEYLIIDNADGTNQPVQRLRTGKQTLNLHFAGSEPAGLRCGDLLAASGVLAGNSLAVSTSRVEASSTSQSCSTTGTQNTAVLLVTFPGVDPPATVTRSSVSDIFFGTAGRSVDGFWREVSSNRANATGSVFGWYTLSQRYTCIQDYELRQAAIDAASADVNFQNYSRVFIVFPDNTCAWSGLSTVGCTTLYSSAGEFRASSALLIAGQLGDRDHAVMLATHEGGHSLGLPHASSRDFGPDALGPLGATGTLSEYGDSFATTGWWNLGHYPAEHKANLLNWMEGTNYQTVQSSGTYTLQPVETAPAGLQALKVRRGTGNDAWLWIEYRQPLGSYDSTLPVQVFTGALVHYRDAFTDGGRSHLLDFTPESDSWLDSALSANKVWVDPYTNLSLSIQSAAPGGLTVSVSYGATPCVHANPTVAISPLNPSTIAGAGVDYAVSVTNNDTAGCASGTFGVSSSQPAGWSTTFSVSSLTLAPGETSSLVMTKTPPLGTAPSIYPFDTTAASGTSSAAGAASCTVVAATALKVEVSVPVSTYSSRQTVPVTATVWDGSATGSGAGVTFKIVRPDASETTKTLASDSTGKATWGYRISPKDPTGTYTVTARAILGSKSATSNTVSFTVK